MVKLGKKIKVWDSPGDAGVGTRGVALVNRDEDLPPSRPDSPGGQPGPVALKCPCGEYHDEDGEFFFADADEDYVDDGSIYSPGTHSQALAGIEALEALGSDVVQEPLTFRERDYPDFHDDCPACGADILNHTDFIMPCSPEELLHSYAQQYLTITPSGWVANSGPDGIILTANGREEHYVLCNAAKQDRAAYGERWTWICLKVGGVDPCDEDFMREISS